MPSQDQEAARHKSAMLSVYYHSLGRQLELRGAPAVALPPAVQPMPLDDALAIVLAGDKNRYREAAWALLRGAPPPPLGDGAKTVEQRYSASARAFLAKVKFDTAAFDDRRGTYRRGSNLLAASLVAYAAQDTDAPTLKALAEVAYQDDFEEAIAASHTLGGQTAKQFMDVLGGLTGVTRARAVAQLRNLQDDVGMSLTSYISEYADTVAFIVTWGDAHPLDPNQAMTVFPASTVVVQDTQTLTTTVTATTLVLAKDFKRITTSLDPCNWAESSDVFKTTRYVADDHATSLPKTAKLPKQGDGFAGTKLLEEIVVVPSGVDPTPIAEFHNVISIDEFTVKEDYADLLFSLARCIDTRYLWDFRPGGILVDEGYVKIRPVATDVWRVTARKVLQFADRTRPGASDRVFDIGQSLNYLAPASLSWWLQTEMYSAEYLQQQRLAKAAAAATALAEKHHEPYTPPQSQPEVAVDG